MPSRRFLHSGKAPGISELAPQQEFRGGFLPLLLHQVLTHIQCAGAEDDRALDDVQAGGADAQHGQGNEDNTQNENAQHDAADLAGTADEGNAADNASCDGMEPERKPSTKPA